MLKRMTLTRCLSLLLATLLAFSWGIAPVVAQDFGFDDSDSVFDGDVGEEFGEELDEEAAEFEEETEDFAAEAENEWEQFWDLDDHGDEYYTDDWYEEDGDFDSWYD